MAKLRCPCGNTLSNDVSPNNVEGIIIKNIDLQFEDKKDLLEVLDLGRDIWECGKCGRLAISFPTKKDTLVKWYVPEDNKPGALMY